MLRTDRLDRCLKARLKRPGDSGTWFVDEIGDYLDKLHHAKFLAGMRGLLLTVYGGKDYRYSRHSKRVKGGATVTDEDFIRACIGFTRGRALALAASRSLWGCLRRWTPSRRG